MKAWFLLVVSISACALADARLALHADEPRVRPLDWWAVETVERGRSRSSVIRHQIAQLEASDIIVHVVTAAVMPTTVAGTTRFVAAVGEHRYLRVVLDRSLLPDQRAATLAHELQHALEFAAAGVRSNEAALALYKRIGHRVGGPNAFFETAAAQRAGMNASAELHGWPRKAATGTAQQQQQQR